MSKVGARAIVVEVGASSKNDAQLSLDVLSMVLGDRQRAEVEAALTESSEQEVQAHKRRKNASDSRDFSKIVDLRFTTT